MPAGATESGIGALESEMAKKSTSKVKDLKVQKKSGVKVKGGVMSTNKRG